MSFLDTLFIDGHDIRTLTGLKITGPIKGLWATGERRGDDDPIPARRGELGAELPLAKYVIEIPVRIFGANRGVRNDNLALIGSLIGGQSGNGLVTLKRRRATGSADDFLEHTARGRYITGLSMEQVNDLTGRVTLQYWNLSGCWKDGSTVIYP